jgi:hypothetical protein
MLSFIMQSADMIPVDFIFNDLAKTLLMPKQNSPAFGGLLLHDLYISLFFKAHGFCE